MNCCLIFPCFSSKKAPKTGADSVDSKQTQQSQQTNAKIATEEIFHSLPGHRRNKSGAKSLKLRTAMLEVTGTEQSRARISTSKSQSEGAGAAAAVRTYYIPTSPSHRVVSTSQSPTSQNDEEIQKPRILKLPHQSTPTSIQQEAISETETAINAQSRMNDRILLETQLLTISVSLPGNLVTS
ncbi:MAG: hypothetical protein H0W88_10035 [Parachlamydiaceae bacterium]|nr:hypothetical protein [Parachlamydiaceae bacterium]